jgi:hypothetical protein
MTGPLTELPASPASDYTRLQVKWGLPIGQIIALEPTGSYEWAIWDVLDKKGCYEPEINS